MKKILLIITIAVFFYSSIDAQVYASEELRIKEEKHIVEKNARLGILPNSESVVLVGEIIEDKVPFDLSLLNDVYMFEDIKAINNESNYTESELENFSNEARIDFEKRYFGISKDLKTLYRINKADLTNFLIDELVLEENILKIIKCKKCQDNNFTILLKNENVLELTFLSQDENDDFIYKLTLKR